MTTMRRSSPLPLLLLALSIGAAAAEPRIGAEHVTPPPATDPLVGGGGVLDPYLQAPPPTAEDVLVGRLELLGATHDAAWAAVGELAPWQGQLDEQARAADVARSIVELLGLDERALLKAARLGAAYLEGRPVSLEGIDIPAALRARIDGLRAQGLSGENAAWLARQELAAVQSGGDVLQRLDASLDLLDLGEDLRSRVSSALRDDAPAPPSEEPGIDGRVRLDRSLERAPDPVLTPSAACPTCPAYHYGTFIPTQSWATHAGSIAATDCRVYRFSLTAGKTYRFTSCEGGGGATFNARLESSSYQNQICAAGPNGVACGGSLNQLDYTPSYSGFFFVKVRNIDAVAGTYRIAFRDLTPRCVGCPAYDFGAFTPTTTWQTQSSSIGPLECRVYRFTVLANRPYRFTLCPTDSDGDPTGASTAFAANLTARNAACTIIGGPAPAPCNPGEEIDVTPTAGGTIYVRVAGDGVGDFGSYTLAYRDISPCANCPAHDFGPFTPSAASYQTHSSSIASSKCKLYRFSVSAGRTYRFVTCDPDTAGNPTGGGASFDTVLEALNASCSFLASNDDSCPGFLSQLDVTPTYTGALYVRMHGYDSAEFGNYTLAYREIPPLCRACPAYDAAPANPTATYQTVSGSFDRNGCYNLRFFLTAGNGYRFTFCDPDGSGMPSGATTSFGNFPFDDTVLELRSTSCGLLAAVDDSCGLLSELDWTTATTGYYYLRVRGFDDGEFGSFTLAYRQRTGACKACPASDFGPFTPGPFWASHGSSIAEEACRVYRFPLTAGHDYQFSLCEGGGSTTFPAVLSARDPACGSTGSSFGTCASPTEDLWFSAATTGVHYVTVAGVTDFDSGPYVLAYRDLSAACQTGCSNGTYSHGPFTPAPAVNFHSDAIESYCHKTYLFNVTAGSLYHFWTCAPGAADFDSRLSVEDPGCSSVGVVDSGACGDDARADYLATYTGPLFVTVSDEGGTGGTYTLAHWKETCSPVYSEDFQASDGGWFHQSIGAGDTWSRRQVACNGEDVGTFSFMSDSSGCAGTTEASKAVSPTILLPTWPSLGIDLDVRAQDELGGCLSGGAFDAKDIGISIDGGASWTTLNDCYQAVTSNGTWEHVTYDISGYGGIAVNIVVAYDTSDSCCGGDYYFAFDNVRILCGP